MDILAKRLIGAATAAVAAVLLAASPTAAYIPLHGYDEDGNIVCDTITFASAKVKVLVHTAEFTETTNGDDSALLQAVKDIDNQIARVGGSAAQISSTTLTTAPFVYKTPFNDTVPTIHVGFVQSLPEKDAAGQEKAMNVSASGCTYNEAQIAILDQSVQAWDMRTPFDTGGSYFAPGGAGPDGAWFRPLYQHELIHAFGLHHTHGSYAAMNYGVKAWANRSAADSIRPLPDDAHGLRELYPGTSTRNEVALLNTWYDRDDTNNGAALQKELCMPSGGVLSAGAFATYCTAVYAPPGVLPTGTLTVCAGNTVMIQVALANYSTEAVQTELHLWFSTDTGWDYLGDTVSADSFRQSVDENNSALLAHGFTVPTGLKAKSTYRPIAQVDSWFDLNGDGVKDTATATTDWIPLRGAVNTC